MTLYWKNLDDFLAMGGYGAYVWGSFGIVALAILVELLALRQRRRALEAMGSMTSEDEAA